MNPTKVKAWVQGPRGGRYYITETGEKKYGKEALEAAKAEDATPPSKDPLALMKQAKSKPDTQALVTKALTAGGFTFDAINNHFPTTGYVVSAHPEREEVHKGAELSEQKLQSYIDKNLEFIEENPGAHLGGWYDVEADKWYLDVSHVTQDATEARKTAAKYNQEAFFDLGKKETVLVKSKEQRRIE